VRRLQASDASKEHKLIKDQAQRLERELHDLTARIAQMQRFYRERYSETKEYDSQRQIRSAENELIRITRKLSSFQPVLKHLSDVRFIEISAETPRKESVNIIDKNVRASVLELRSEEEPESGMTNG
jgi:hypothetical protein